VRKLANRRRSRSSRGMSSTAKTDMPRSGRPSSAHARAVRSAWRRSLSTVSEPPRMRSVAAAGGCSFRNRLRCSIRSLGTRTGLVSPLRTVLLPDGLGQGCTGLFGPRSRCTGTRVRPSQAWNPRLQAGEDVNEALSSQCHHPAQANGQRSPCPRQGGPCHARAIPVPSPDELRAGGNAYRARYRQVLVGTGAYDWTTGGPTTFLHVDDMAQTAGTLHPGVEYTLATRHGP